MPERLTVALRNIPLYTQQGGPLRNERVEHLASAVTQLPWVIGFDMFPGGHVAPIGEFSTRAEPPVCPDGVPSQAATITDGQLMPALLHGAFGRTVRMYTFDIAEFGKNKDLFWKIGSTPFAIKMMDDVIKNTTTEFEPMPVPNPGWADTGVPFPDAQQLMSLTPPDKVMLYGAVDRHESCTLVLDIGCPRSEDILRHFSERARAESTLSIPKIGKHVPVDAYYPIPVGSPLYQQFLDVQRMVYELTALRADTIAGWVGDWLGKKGNCIENQEYGTVHMIEGTNKVMHYNRIRQAPVGQVSTMFLSPILPLSSMTALDAAAFVPSYDEAWWGRSPGFSGDFIAAHKDPAVLGAPVTINGKEMPNLSMLRKNFRSCCTTQSPIVVYQCTNCEPTRFGNGFSAGLLDDDE